MDIQTKIKEFEQTAKRQAAMVVGFRDDKVLILRRSGKEKWMSGRWNLPGGAVEDGETPRDAAKRECREESGLTPEKMKLLMRVEKTHIVLWVFRAELPDQQILLDPMESIDYAWVNKYTIENYDFVPDCKDWIKRVIE